MLFRPMQIIGERHRIEVLAVNMTFKEPRLPPPRIQTYTDSRWSSGLKDPEWRIESLETKPKAGTSIFKNSHVPEFPGLRRLSKPRYSSLKMGVPRPVVVPSIFEPSRFRGPLPHCTCTPQVNNGVRVH